MRGAWLEIFMIGVSSKERAMPLTNLIRWGGIAAGVAGVLLSIAGFLGLTGKIRADIWAEQHWAIGNGLALLGILLVLLGLLGLYAAYQVRTSHIILGLIVFPVASLGAVLIVGIGAGWLQAYVSSEALEVLRSRQLANPLPLGFTLSFALVAVVWALFGVATGKAFIHPQTAALLLIIGALPVLTPLFIPLSFAYIALNAYAIWLGLTLWLNP
jgi:hypothetical protein